MTPTIRTAAFPKFDRDKNKVALKDLASLALANFEFFPHFEGKMKYHRALKKESEKIKIPLYACNDGSGIVVEGTKITFVGKVWCFARGRRYIITPPEAVE